jgi:hypothetical protein
VVGVLILGAIVGPAPTATAKTQWTVHGYTYVVATGTALSEQQVSTEALCPGETVPVGGGIKITGGYNAGVSINSTEPSDGVAGWIGWALNEGGSDKPTTAYAICRDAVPDYYTASKPVPAGDQNASTQAVCVQPVSGDPSTPLGGGIHVTGGFDAHVDAFVNQFVNDTFNDTYVWLVLANSRGETEEEVTATVICDQSKKRFVRKSVLVDPGTVRTEKAPCPRGTIVSGGGASIGNLTANAPDRLVSMSASAPYDSGDEGLAPEDGWRGTLRNATPNLQQGYVFAVCVKV